MPCTHFKLQLHKKYLEEIKLTKVFVMKVSQNGKIKNKKKKQQKQAKMVAAATRKINKVNYIRIASLGLAFRKNHKSKENIYEVSSRLHRHCSSLGMKFVVNFDIEGSCLNRRNLHVNRKSTSISIRNISNFLNLISA